MESTSPIWNPPARSTMATRMFWITAGFTFAFVAIIVAAGSQAGATSSAALGGTSPTAGSLELLYSLIGLLSVGAGLIAWGGSPAWARLPPSARSGQSPSYVVAQAPMVVRFVGVFLAALGLGLLTMGWLILSPAFCLSHGPGLCELVGPITDIPKDLETIGAALAFVGGVSAGATPLIRRTNSVRRG